MNRPKLSTQKEDPYVTNEPGDEPGDELGSDIVTEPTIDYTPPELTLEPAPTSAPPGDYKSRGHTHAPEFECTPSEPGKQTHPLVAEGRKDWTKKRFQAWLALPRAMRPDTCSTQEQFGVMTGVSREALRKWKLEPGFWDDVYSDAATLVGDELPQIIKAMMNEAIMGSVRAAKFCFEMLGLDKPIKITISDPLVVILSTEQVQAAQEDEPHPK